MELLHGLLEAEDAAIEFGRDTDVFAEELGEAARAEAGGAGELGDGGDGGRGVEGVEGEADEWGVGASASLMELGEEEGFQEVELCGGGGEFAEVVAEGAEGGAPEVFEWGLAVGEEVGRVREEGQGSGGVEGDADELGEVNGVDVLVEGVEAEEEGGGGVGERVGGLVGVGEIVAGKRDDDLGVAGGENALAGVRGVGIAPVPEGLDVGGEGGMGWAPEVEHGVGL